MIGYDVIYTSMQKKIWGQSGVRSCILPRQPTHLVQELKVGTVGYLDLYPIYDIAEPLLKRKGYIFSAFTFILSLFNLKPLDQLNIFSL